MVYWCDKMIVVNDVPVYLFFQRLGHPEVFDLISKHALFSSIHDKLEVLFKLDEQRAITMLLDSISKIPISVVVKRLNKCPQMVYQVGFLSASAAH